MAFKLFFLTVLLSLPAIMQAQVYNTIEVIGYAKVGNKNLKEATITLGSNTKKPDTVFVTLDGKFILLLEFDKDYIIEVSKEGYVSKRIEFCTRNVPEKKKRKEPYGFDFDISLFEDTKDFQSSVFKKPVAKVIYSNEKGYFDYDDDYTQQQQLNFFKSFQKQIKIMEQELATATAKRDNMLREIQEIKPGKPTAEVDVQKIIDSAMQVADSIVMAAKLTSNITSLMKLYDTISKRPDEVVTKSRKTEKELILTEFESKSMEDINKMLNDTNELMKREEEIYAIKKQLEADKQKAITKTDSLLIREREARINAEEIKVLLVKKMAKHAETSKEMEAEPLLQNILVLSALLFLFLSLLFWYKKYQLKKKIRSLSEKELLV